MEYDGTVVNYYYNGSLVYTSLQSVTQPLHIFFPLLTENEGVINVCVIGTPEPSPTPTPTPILDGFDYPSFASISGLELVGT